jgi:hypothetical protein
VGAEGAQSWQGASETVEAESHGMCCYRIGAWPLQVGVRTQPKYSACLTIETTTGPKNNVTIYARMNNSYELNEHPRVETILKFNLTTRLNEKHDFT